MKNLILILTIVIAIVSITDMPKTLDNSVSYAPSCSHNLSQGLNCK